MQIFFLLVLFFAFVLYQDLSRAPPPLTPPVSPSEQKTSTPPSRVELAPASIVATTPSTPPAASPPISHPVTRTPPPSPPAPHTGRLEGEQRRRAEALTSVFENGTPTISYAAIERLEDGRGYTAGRAGFTTATGDAFLVVQRYTNIVPQNPLANYLNTLERLADGESDDISDLDGFEAAWRETAKDARFRAAQDTINDELYFEPAMSTAASLGIRTALGQAILYDTIIQHGGGTDDDSLSALVTRTTNRVGGTPKTGVDESRWLAAFLAVRAQDLLHPANRTTQEVWAASVGRVYVLEQLLTDRNLELRGPIKIDTPEYEAVIR